MFGKYIAPSRNHEWMFPVMEWIETVGVPESHEIELSPHFYDSYNALYKYSYGRFHKSAPFPCPVFWFDSEESLFRAAHEPLPVIGSAPYPTDGLFGMADVYPILKTGDLKSMLDIFWRLIKIEFSCDYKYLDKATGELETTQIYFNLIPGWHGRRNANISPSFETEDLRELDSNSFDSKYAPRRKNLVKMIKGVDGAVAIYKYKPPALTYYTSANVEYPTGEADEGVYSGMPEFSVCGVAFVQSPPEWYLLGSPYILGTINAANQRPICAIGDIPENYAGLGEAKKTVVHPDHGITIEFLAMERKNPISGETYDEFSNPSFGFEFADWGSSIFS